MAGEPGQPGPEVPEVPEGAELGPEQPDPDMAEGGDDPENLTEDDGTEAGETM